MRPLDIGGRGIRRTAEAERVALAKVVFGLPKQMRHPAINGMGSQQFSKASAFKLGAQMLTSRMNRAHCAMARMALPGERDIKWCEGGRFRLAEEVQLQLLSRW